MTSKRVGQTVGVSLDGLIYQLAKNSDTPGLDATVLMAHVLDRPRSWVLAHPEALVPGRMVAVLKKLVGRLEEGEPLPYVLGTWEFFDLEFYVTPEVLIPRPETEMIVTRAISWLNQPRNGDQELKVLDIGTGSGCIAIALAVNMPGVIITATDISPSALKIARRNAKKMGVAGRITFLEADLIPDSSSPNSFPIILANLPYIPTTTLHKLNVYEHEPTVALDGGSDGLVLIRRLLAKAPEALAPGGMMLLEVESTEGPAVSSLASTAFPKARIQLQKDLAGLDRMLEIQL